MTVNPTSHPVGSVGLPSESYPPHAMIARREVIHQDDEGSDAEVTRRIPVRRRHGDDPNRPRLPPTAFMAFSNLKRAEYASSGQKPKDMAHQLGALWRQLPESEQEKWKMEYKVKKAQYDADLREYYTANPDAKLRDENMRRAKQQHDRSKRGSSMTSAQNLVASGKGLEPPKRPKTAFFCYVKEERPVVAKENPEMRPTDVTKELSRRWREMPPEEKSHYEGQADIDKKRYQHECGVMGYEPASEKRARKRFAMEQQSQVPVPGHPGQDIGA